VFIVDKKTGVICILTNLPFDSIYLNAINSRVVSYGIGEYFDYCNKEQGRNWTTFSYSSGGFEELTTISIICYARFYIVV
jgi:hypothetical protein